MHFIPTVHGFDKHSFISAKENYSSTERRKSNILLSQFQGHKAEKIQYLNLGFGKKDSKRTNLISQSHFPFFVIFLNLRKSVK